MNSFVSVSSMANLAAREAMMQELSNMPPQSELKEMFETSAQHEKMIHKAIRKEKRIENFSKFGRKFSNISVVLVICFSVFFTPVLSAKAVRESIAQTIIEWKDEFSRIFIESDAEPITINNVEIGYIPEGYVLDGEPIYGEGKYRSVYIKELNYMPIHIDIYSDSSYLNTLIDNEYMKYYNIGVDDAKGIWIYGDSFNTLALSDNKFTYIIEGYCTINNIITIYKNILIS